MTLENFWSWDDLQISIIQGPTFSRYGKSELVMDSPPSQPARVPCRFGNGYAIDDAGGCFDERLPFDSVRDQVDFSRSDWMFGPHFLGGLSSRSPLNAAGAPCRRRSSRRIHLGPTSAG